MSYSEALEKQVQLLRWWMSDGVPPLWDTDPELVARASAAGMTVPKEAAPAIRAMLKFGDTYYWGRDQSELLANVSESVPKSATISLEMFGNAGFHWFEKPLPIRGDGERWPILAIAHVRALDGIEYAAWEDWRHNRSLESDPDVYGFWPYGMPLGELHPPDRRPIWAVCWATLFSGAAFLQQRILTAPSVLAERHARKRLLRDGWQPDPLIRVVQLRRKERVGGNQSGQPVEREWSCQWVVRGHWRQQFYPSKHRNQPIWITPYVKGPEDKPLKAPRATVFAVVR